MAADIQRYLSDEPIVARRPSVTYQLKKFARRNKAPVTGVAAVFVVLVALAAFAWQAGVAGKERDRALKAEGRANDNERVATQALARETELWHVAENLGRALIPPRVSGGPYKARVVTVIVDTSPITSSTSDTKHLSIAFSPDGRKMAVTTVAPAVQGAIVRIETRDESPRQR
jgi:hypothetical protein